MHAGVVAQIDQGDGALDAAEGGLDYGCGGAGEGDDGAVMIGIQFAVEDGDAAHGADGFDDGVYLGGVAAFGEIGDTLDKLGAGGWGLGAGVHVRALLVSWCIRSLFAPK